MAISEVGASPVSIFAADSIVRVAADADLWAIAAALVDADVGALAIGDGDEVVGIVSERDIVRVVAKEGAAALDIAVRSAMTPKVKICNENHTVNEIMEIMTRGRFRHLPVEKDGLLDGIVSIGDVVKRRIEDVEREAEEIRAYIATA